MRSRVRLAVVLALTSSCGHANSDPTTTPYALTLTGPTAPFKGSAEVTATPTPASGTTAVHFLIDGVESAVEKAAPYTATLDFSEAWGGVHHVTALADRDDGATARASIDVTYDPFGPSVTVLTPVAGAHLAPTGGMLGVSFLAADGGGLSAGAVRLDQGAAVPIPLPSLSLTVPFTAATVLPVPHTLSWWLDDAAGNRTEGTVAMLQTHERFDVPTATVNGAFPVAGGRVVVVGATALESYGTDGSLGWSFEPGGSVLAHAFPAKDGEVFAVEQTTTNEIIERVRADGTAAWSWPAPGASSAVTATYFAATDSLVAVRSVPMIGGITVVLVDAAGHESVVATYPNDPGALLLTTREGVSPAGFAVITGNDTRVAVFDAGGAPAWSVVLDGASQVPELLTRDALLGLVDTPSGSAFAIVGPSGVTATLGGLDFFTSAPDGDAVTTATLADSTHVVTRLHPDGSMVWQTTLTAVVDALAAHGDIVAVGTSGTVRFVDGAGGVVGWEDPGDDGQVLSSANVVFSPSGAYYVLGPLQTADVRICRVAADGTTVWRETVPAGGVVLAGSSAPDDERAVFSVAQRAYVFEP